MLNLLKSRFVVAWTNNSKKKYVGNSGGYHRKQTAVGTTNGAGGRNVQIFILSKDLHVLHALPGFWHPVDFERALRFGLALNRLWEDESRTTMQKMNMFYRMQMAELRMQPDELVARSQWQRFDQRAEQRKHRLSPRDTITDADGGFLKPINQIVHERMVYYPLVPFADFDTAAFADLGLGYYDLNRRVDGKGRGFWHANRTNRLRARTERIASEKLRKLRLKRRKSERASAMASANAKPSS